MQSNIRIIELLRFLYQQTDEAHAVTVSEMIEYLKSKGIPSVRQTVYTDLEALDTAGIDIVQIKSTQNRYFIGSRIFEYPELKMLVDAVASSKVISAKKSQALIQKLGQLTSIQQAEQLQRLASLSSRVKPHNEKVYYIIDSIQTAILDQHQISFQYYEYTPEKKKILKHDGYRYILDPYALEWKNDHYYLIGYSHKHKGIAHFRVDRLTSVEPLDSKFQPMPDFDVAAYTNKMVDMFAAEHAEQVKLLCSNELMRVIIDHYGEDIEISPYDDTHFTVIIEVNPSGTFYGWVFKFMGKIRILSPQSCVDKMQDIARTFI
ncbi:helix-turn-helix transcriptional regulator [Pseudoflavonifractor gallinarum]|jgi:predicted DNA-binding transcriptional regulator YafY